MKDLTLKTTGKGIKGNLLFVIMDGVGLYRGRSEGYPGNSVDLAEPPTLRALFQSAPIQTRLKAHGTAVGLPSDEDMGNSEVGHNAMGAGRIFDQGAKLVSNAIQTGAIFRGKAWMELVGNKENPGIALAQDHAVHFIGLLSDGNVHSHIDHLLALIDECHRQGVKRVFVHPLLDGRDVEEMSAHIYIEKLESKLQSIDPTGTNYAIASGGGRMKVTMDRYEADWEMVELGWKTHVKGEGRMFASAADAVATLRKEAGGHIVDQDLPAFVIAKGNSPVGPIRENDAVIYFNFRGDRALEISRAFTEQGFNKFKKDPDIHVHYAGMMEYDGDLKIPPRYLVNPPSISLTLSEYLVRNGVSQYAISETQKFGHVTYFWNGNNSEKFDANLETWVEIPSDRISFDRAPAMKAYEIGDALVEAMAKHRYRFLRVNFANGDMVGHTGVLDAAVRAVQAVDANLKRLLDEAHRAGVTVIITADHGNCEEMYMTDKKGNVKHNENGTPTAKTSHTLNAVPFFVTGAEAAKFRLNPDVKEPGLGNIASTIMTVLGFEPPADYLPSILDAI